MGLGGQGKVTRCSNWGRQSWFWQWAGALEEVPGRPCCAPYLNRADELAPFQRRMTRAERDPETRRDRDAWRGKGMFAEEEMTWMLQLEIWRAVMGKRGGWNQIGQVIVMGGILEVPSDTLSSLQRRKTRLRGWQFSAVTQPASRRARTGQEHWPWTRPTHGHPAGCKAVLDVGRERGW